MNTDPMGGRCARQCPCPAPSELQVIHRRRRAFIADSFGNLIEPAQVPA